MFFKVFVFSIFAIYLLLLVVLLGRRFWRSRSKSPSEKLPARAEASSGKTFLDILDLSKAFDYPVLKGINLRIQRGETLGVLGMSGTGKSVLLKLVAGLLKPDQGYIVYRSRDITKMSESDLLNYRKKVTYVF
ncbi:MAG: ATP-binding cassette domain-containing protein, partial [Acidobacteriota bacterium]